MCFPQTQQLFAQTLNYQLPANLSVPNSSQLPRVGRGIPEATVGADTKRPHGPQRLAEAMVIEQPNVVGSKSFNEKEEIKKEQPFPPQT
jgi:hypothetical protein